MLDFAAFDASHYALITGVILTLLGIALLTISFGRRLNEAGEVLRGFFLGTGLALLLGGLLFNTQVPPETLGGVAKTTANGAPVLVNLGEQIATEVRMRANYIQNRTVYFVPICTIVVLLLSGLVGRRAFAWAFGRDTADFLRGFLLAALIPLAFLAAGNYLDWGKFRQGTYFNAYEFYHYYIGTKYAPEVGYSNMYNASLIADDETGGGYRSSNGTLRDLSNGVHVKIDVMKARKDEFKALFSEARWQEFLKDIRFFKSELNAGRWSSILSDKGYNGTPYWTMWVGGLLSERVDTANRNAMMALALLDPLLITLALLCVWRAFGLRPALLMIILIGTSYVMRFSHMKGAFLRTDFAMSLVIAICMLKLRHFRTAGALMMYAALARVFPAVFFFGAGVKLVQNVVLHWRPRLRSLLHGVIAVPLLGAALIAALHFSVPMDWQEGISKAVPLPAGLVPAAQVVLLLECMVGLAVAAGLVALWLFNQSPECRPYVQLFSSALAVMIIMSAAVMADSRTGKRYVDDFASKIGRHLNDISPWRVGYKYVFINESNIARERSAMPTIVSRLAPKVAPQRVDEQPDEVDAEVLNTAPLVTVAKPNLSGNPAPDPFRVARETYRDMRTAAARAWADAQKGTLVGSKTALPAPTSRWESVKLGIYNFFKTYVPSPRGTIYREKAEEWKLTMLLVLLVSFFAVLGLKDHEALAWSFVPTFFLVAPTYYYYIMLTIPLLFFTSALERPSRRLGAILLIAMAMPGHYLYSDLKYNQQFATYYWHSVMYLGLVLYMLVLGYGDGIAGLFRAAFGKKQTAEATPR